MQRDATKCTLIKQHWMSHAMHSLFGAHLLCASERLPATYCRRCLFAAVENHLRNTYTHIFICRDDQEPHSMTYRRSVNSRCCVNRLNIKGDCLYAFQPCWKNTFIAFLLKRGHKLLKRSNVPQPSHLSPWLQTSLGEVYEASICRIKQSWCD